jgi:ABC-2 type transport system ATP-binding protein
MIGEIADDFGTAQGARPGVTAAIELDHVVKRYDGTTAVNDLSLAVAPGNILGLLGPNGAGKTSTIRMMLGIMIPDAGVVRMFGVPLGRRSLREAGYLPEERGLYAKMTVRENLVFFGQLAGLDAAGARRSAEAWCERLSINSRLDDRVGELSKGMQQKIQFITSVIHDPAFIVLDEPFTGLDPINVHQLRSVLNDLRTKGKAIVFSSHRTDQIEQLCDSVCLMNRGRSVLQGTVREIKSGYRQNFVQIEYEGSGSFLDGNPLIDSYERHADFVEVRLKPGADPQALLRKALDVAQIRRFEIKEASIEQIFIDLMTKRAGDG